VIFVRAWANNEIGTDKTCQVFSSQ